MINGRQCHAARALIDINREQLAKESGLSKELITNFERKIIRPKDSQIQQLQDALEDLGAIFLADGEHGFGVRLKYSVEDAWQVAQMEDEGGAIVAEDFNTR